MRALLAIVCLMSCAPLGAHDFWIEPSTLSLRVGENFAGDEIPFNPIDLRRRGPWVFYQSKANFLEITPAKFEQFLREEGLPRVRTTNPHREHFYRYAKSLVGSAGFAQPLGLRLELVPLTDPHSASALQMQVLFEGKPLSRALVTAIHRDDPARRASARTSDRGTVSLTLSNGIWLIKTVHLVPGKHEPWESLWASLTFER